VLEQPGLDAGAHPGRPRLVQLVDVERGHVAEQHPEGEERLHRHRVKPGRLGDRVPHPGQARPHQIADLNVAAGGEALQLQQERGAVRQ
jgi:hypothetical protein